MQIFFKKAKFTYLILQQEKQKLLIKLAIHIYYISYGGTSNRREHGLAEGSVGKPSARRSQRQSRLGRTIARLNKMVGQRLWYMTAHKMPKRHATIFFLILNCTIKLVHLKMWKFTWNKTSVYTAQFKLCFIPNCIILFKTSLFP